MKKHITRILALVMTIAMLLSLTACGHEHEWLDANCLTPRTCASCGETEGEALGHTWADATCNAPKTCSACGETEGETLDHSWTDAACEAPKTCTVCSATEGEALGHAWIEANYQQSRTCSVCAATEGEPLTAAFVENGLDARLLDMNGEYDLTTRCYDDETKDTTGTLTVESYKTITSDETHEALDGYEWKLLHLKVHFSDENAFNHGIYGVSYLWTDYYEDGPEGDSEEEEDGFPLTFDWNGVAYEDGLVRFENEGWGEWVKDENGQYSVDFVVTAAFRVPVGYDGCVFGIAHWDWEWPDGTYLQDIIDDTALLFRLD